ncbi:MAG: hypothetical protein ABIP93_08640 [Gemmatimonadaceae bacterium]
MALLPAVLAGPIVRRVEPRLCTFWIALSSPSSAVTATIWRGTQMTGPIGGSVTTGDAAAGTTTTSTRRFGKQLHVALVTVKLDAPALPLQPGAIYSYDITVDGKGLKQLGLLADETESSIPEEQRGLRPLGLALGYVTDRLPSFVTPPPVIEQTRIAQCSCRNTIGPGYDALAWLDEIIEDRLQSPERPQQLFMTGDQIYADDLSGSLLFMLSELSKQIVGPTEQLRAVAPLPSGGTIDKAFDVNLTNFPAYRRHKLTLQLGGYTSGDGENHLLGYGEYCAMYLAVWSPRVWGALGTPDQLYLPLPPEAIDLWPFFDEPEKAKKFKGSAVAWRDAAKQSTSWYNMALDRLELFRIGVPHVARVLANVATYMIFDDHDVTDDWNLSKKWTNRVYSKPFGRQIVRNAVMSYAVFQGWGNDPLAFEKEKNKELLGEVEKLFAGVGPYPAAPTERIDTLIGVTGAAFGEQATWNYIVPAPKMQVIVLDTRTRRKFTGQGYLPPDLVGLDRNAQIPAGPLADGREVVFIVSAAPVLNPDLIDSLGWPIAQLAIDSVHFGKGLDGSGTQKANIGTEKYDAEGWSSNEVAREALLKRIATYQSAVILSGDVHFAYSLALDYYTKDGKPPSRIVQLTASPARNQFKPVVRLLVRQNPFLQLFEKVFNFSRLGWDGPSSMLLPSEVFISPGRRSRLTRSPAIVPADGWPAGTNFPDDKPPDWRWRLSLVRDLRKESDVPAKLRQPLLPESDELKETSALTAYRALAARHQTTAITRADYVRQVVFKSNFGLISLSKSGQVITLRHTLISESEPEGVTPAEGTVHDISLASSPEAAPKVGFR